MNEYTELIEKIAHIEESVKSAHKRIDETKELTESVYKLATSIEAMQNDIKESKKRIEKIEDKPELPPCQHIKDFERFDKLEGEVKVLRETPVKRWEKFVGGLITSLAGGIVGYILAVILK